VVIQIRPPSGYGLSPGAWKTKRRQQRQNNIDSAAEIVQNHLKKYFADSLYQQGGVRKSKETLAMLLNLFFLA